MSFVGEGTKEQSLHESLPLSKWKNAPREKKENQSSTLSNTRLALKIKKISLIILMLYLYIVKNVCFYYPSIIQILVIITTVSLPLHVFTH